MYSSLIIQSSNFFLVFSFLIYNPFFLLLFLFEVSPLSFYVPSSFVVWILLSLTGVFLQLIFSILRHTFILKASNLVMPSFLIFLISAQYKVTLQISVFNILFLRHLHSSQSSFW